MRLRIGVKHPGESWIIDRVIDEYAYASCHDVVSTDGSPITFDAVWLTAPWVWRSVSRELLDRTPTLCTIHHEVPDKFDARRATEFAERDRFVTRYHVTCVQTMGFITPLTERPITKIPYWVNDRLWIQRDKDVARQALRSIAHFEDGELVIGSFQRDTEGSSCDSCDPVPKLEKGPDAFCDVVHAAVNAGTRIHVLLSGWRRQYVIKRLLAAGIKHTYVQLPDFDTLRNLYAACDLYLVTSRFEGGPQAALECAAMHVPIVSTDCGMVRDVLPDDCVLTTDAMIRAARSGEFHRIIPPARILDDAYAKVMEFKLRKHVAVYDDLFERLAMERRRGL